MSIDARRLRIAERHERHQALAAGDDRRVGDVLALGDDARQLVDRRWSDVAEGRGLHADPYFTAEPASTRSCVPLM